MKEIEDNPMEDDPAYCAGWNDALEWAAVWLTGSANTGYGAEAIGALIANAQTVRAVKKPVQQQSFFDAVRNDPYMQPEVKAYWLAMETAEDQCNR